MATISLPQLSLKEAREIVGGLTSTTKMPCKSLDIPASLCKVGSQLRKIKGSTCSNCYACKGNYAWNNVQQALHRRYKALSDPRWITAMVFVIKGEARQWFRWHSSGDLQDMDHLLRIVEVVRQTPGVQHWLPTREFALIRRYRREHGEFPENLTVRVSATMMDDTAPDDFENTSEVARTDGYAEMRASQGASVCPAYTQGGQCLECRSCWDRNVKTVVYPKH
jgi:hypothetical protein